ncbi:MAG TPA: hypothetical protein VLW75_07195 [Rhizomicrobium sp.]|nr:hypothetical protein [Rhizomicrobium sp.]
MNPELQRNLWLELTPRRLATMAIILLLIFFASGLSGGLSYRPASVAVLLYYFIVVIWGARNAALSVVGEIRDRTWDLQRLSSLGAGEMTWGKLFGATAYNWYGGALCLAVMLAYGFAHSDPVSVVIGLVYYLAVGLIAQAAALLASLIAVRRRQSHTRLEIFFYQLAGLIAAVAVFAIWDMADPAGSILTRKPPTDFIVWWGHAYDARLFLLASLALFAGWTLVACYRTMRLELQMNNGPLVWLGFLVFIGIYVAGFDAWLSRDPAMADWDSAALRLGLAATAYGLLTYVMVVLEPKDRVHYRWLASETAKGHLVKAAGGLQAWMTSYIATLIFSGLLIWWRVADTEAIVLIAAGLGFLTRDISLFVLIHALPGKRRGDFAALLALFALYVLAPAIVKGLDLKGALIFFYPQPGAESWLGPAIAWAEAVFVALLAAGRVAIAGKPASAPA